MTDGTAPLADTARLRWDPPRRRPRHPITASPRRRAQCEEIGNSAPPYQFAYLYRSRDGPDAHPERGSKWERGDLNPARLLKSLGFLSTRTPENPLRPPRLVTGGNTARALRCYQPSPHRGMFQGSGSGMPVRAATSRRDRGCRAGARRPRETWDKPSRVSDFAAAFSCSVAASRSLLCSEELRSRRASNRPAWSLL